MLSFWLAAAVLTLLAMAFLLVPLWRNRLKEGGGALSGPLTALAIAPVAIALYLHVSTYDADVEPLVSNAQLDVLEQLAARLGDNPDDIAGWMLLGRSYRTLGNYALARQAYEQAWTRTEVPDDDLKLSYAETLIFTEPGLALTVAGDLIEDVLVNAPRNQAALWLGSIVAIERNQRGLAAERLNALLATNPPAEVGDMIRAQLASLGMSPAPAASADSAPVAGPVIEVEVSVADTIALDSFGPGARLYVFAQGPDMPAPLAVRQETLDSLPGRFSLSDRDNPMAQLAGGRTLGAFDTVKVTAKISASGSVTSQPGDAFAEATTAPGSGETVRLVIDRIVPGG